eukprot:3024619-Amphidinium_carterae.1
MTFLVSSWQGHKNTLSQEKLYLQCAPIVDCVYEPSSNNFGKHGTASTILSLTEFIAKRLPQEDS